MIHTLRIISNWHQIRLRAHIPTTFKFLDSQSLTRFSGILPRSSHEIPGTGHLILDTIDGLLDYQALIQLRIQIQVQTQIQLHISNHKELAPNTFAGTCTHTHSGSSIPRALYDSRESTRILTRSPPQRYFHRAPRFFCWDNQIVAPRSSVVACGGS